MAVILVMAATSAVSLRLVHRQGLAMAELGDVWLPISRKLDAALDVATQTHVELFRTVMWAANSDDTSKRRLYADRVYSGLVEVTSIVDSLPQGWGTEASMTDLISAARHSLQSYAASAKTVLKMAEIDPVTAIVMMFEAERNFGLLRNALGALRTAGDDRTTVSVERALAAESKAEISFLGLLATAVLISAALTALIARLNSRPIRAMTDAMAALARGEQAVAIPATGRKDEVGRMAGAVQVFRDAMVAAQRLMRESDAAREQRTERSAHIEALSEEFEVAVAKLTAALSSAAEEMRGTAQSMAIVATRTDRRSIAVAAAAAAAEQDVATIAAATEELSRSVIGIGRLVASSTEVTQAAVLEARRTHEVAGDLEQGVRSVDQIVTLIQGIAAQTKLLALNAAIEAARAGDAGKGFAVVANEVKTLANQTSKATQEIANYVRAIEQAATGTVRAIDRINQTIIGVGKSSEAVGSAILEQERATAEIASAISNLADGRGELSSNSQALRDMAGATGEAAHSVLDAVSRLYARSEEITQHVQSYLAGVKAA